MKNHEIRSLFFSHSAAFNGYLMDIGGPVDGTNGGTMVFSAFLPSHSSSLSFSCESRTVKTGEDEGMKTHSKSPHQKIRTFT